MKIKYEELKKLNDDGLTIIEISEKLNCSRASVVREKKKYGLKSFFHEKRRKYKKCLECDVDFLESCDKKFFCSKKCSLINLNKKKRIYFHKCINCNNDIITHWKGAKFCCRKCFFEYKKNELYLNIENGNENSSRQYKKYLIEKYGEKCMKCGWSEMNTTSGKIPIELEHKDGNSDNNNLENLELLCPNCHSLTPTYKALNVGNGRYKRKQRYKEGKSF